MADPKEPQGPAPEPTAPQPQPPVEQPAAEQPTEKIEQPTETVSAAEAPAPPPAEPQPVPVVSDRRARFGRFTRHRATGLVAAGLLGLVIGGGLVAVFDHDDRGRGSDRAGVSRHDDRGGDHGRDRFER